MDCAGQLLPIAENDVLFQLIGTTYGGDGQETFGLPNLASRVPVHQGLGGDGIQYTTGELAGAEQVTLTNAQIVVHSHAALATNAPASTNSPTNAVPANLLVALQQFPYGQGTPVAPLDNSSVGPAGGSQPHTNIQPSGVARYIISLFGIFPSPS
jgi:microcystin-dependent protein